jgi:membrane-associated phospholipid phosphatase
VQDDAALQWNRITLEAIRSAGITPPEASRVLAIESIAVYDAVAAVQHGTTFLPTAAAPAHADASVAAAAAAEAALEALFPTLKASFQADLAALSKDACNAASLDFGHAVGASVAAHYANDGWDKAVTLPERSDAPGVWQPTPNLYLPAINPQWATLQPFAMTSPDQVRPPPPPALDSAAYRQALQQVEALGAANSTLRTAEQTEIAKFWADGAGTYTPPGHWNVIADQIAEQRGEGLAADALMLAKLNVALADAGIAAWDAKFDYEFWRPVTAIRATEGQPDWLPLLPTPAFPSYVSGHSTFSAAAAAVLGSVYGQDVPFDTTSPGMPGVTRHFDGFEDAAKEAGMSRIYGGIHFAFDDQAGQAMGRQVAAIALDAFEAVTPAPKPVDWNALAKQVEANHAATGKWFADPVTPPAPAPAPVDWNALAKQVEANHAATGHSHADRVPAPGQAATDWHALAAQVEAHHAATGQWYL